MNVEQATRLLVSGEVDEIRIKVDPDDPRTLLLTMHKDNHFGLCRISAQELFINPKPTASMALELALINLISPETVQMHRCSFCHPRKPSAMERNFARSFGGKHGEEESKEETLKEKASEAVEEGIIRDIFQKAEEINLYSKPDSDGPEKGPQRGEGQD